MGGDGPARAWVQGLAVVSTRAGPSKSFDLPGPVCSSRKMTPQTGRCHAVSPAGAGRGGAGCSDTPLPSLIAAQTAITLYFSFLSQSGECTEGAGGGVALLPVVIEGLSPRGSAVPRSPLLHAPPNLAGRAVGEGTGELGWFGWVPAWRWYRAFLLLSVAQTGRVPLPPPRLHRGWGHGPYSVHSEEEETHCAEGVGRTEVHTGEAPRGLRPRHPALGLPHPTPAGSGGAGASREPVLAALRACTPCFCDLQQSGVQTLSPVFPFFLQIHF